MSKLQTSGLVAAGFLLGTAGVKILSSKDAKCAYTHITAAVLRCKDTVMKQTSILKENCQDIAADAKDINDKRYEEEEKREIEDAKAVLERAQANA